MADISITASNVVPPNASTTVHRQPTSTICGEAISAGEVVCVLAADSKYYKADANDADKRAVVGIAGNSSVAAGQRLDVITQSPALAVGTHGVSVGDPLFLSSTPGKMCPYADLAAGALPVLVAYSATSTTLQVELAASNNAKP